MTESAVSQSGTQPTETAPYAIRPVRILLFRLMVLIVGEGGANS